MSEPSGFLEQFRLLDIGLISPWAWQIAKLVYGRTRSGNGGPGNGDSLKDRLSHAEEEIDKLRERTHGIAESIQGPVTRIAVLESEVRNIGATLQRLEAGVDKLNDKLDRMAAR